MPAVIGDPHPYFQKFIQPRITSLRIRAPESAETYQRIYEAQGDFAANTWLRKTHSEGRFAFPKLEVLEQLGIPAEKHWAKEEPGRIQWLEEIHSLVRPFFDKSTRLDYQHLPEALATQWHLGIGFAKDEAELEKVADKAKSFLERLSLSFPKGKSTQTSLLRLQDASWWRRQLSTVLPRIIDQVGRSEARVHRKKEIYLSDVAFEMFRKRQKSSRMFLEDLVATNDIGQEYSLAELSDSSVSNPTNRRVELMVRIRGCEEWATECEHGAIFVTLTAASKYHRFSGKADNQKWSGCDPRQVNNELNRIWARCRSAFSREGISFNGIRVAEPHHDGTPHWHLMIFSAELNLLRIGEIIRHYGLAEDGHEPGAKQHRVKIEQIDTAKGSAAGYIAKYISKSIDGFGIESDLYGCPAGSSAARIVAWSRVWGIRQFQFFGSPPIGPWRELRRVRRNVPHPYELMRVAADSGDFKSYLLEALSNGVCIYREPWIDSETGECSPPYNAYGEPLDDAVKGLVCDDVEPLLTKLLTWSIAPKSASVARSLD